MASALALLAQAIAPKTKATEGEYRPGPYLLEGGWLSATAGRVMNWWQNGHSLAPYGECSAMVEACISAYAQTIAMCPGGHWRKDADGGRTLIEGSPLSRILARPNDYQSMSDVLLNLGRALYGKGEAFGVVLRDARGEPAELHLMRQGSALIAEDGTIFYQLAGNEVLEQRMSFADPIPARDVLHVRLHTPRNPLKGESPILSTVLDQALAGVAMNQQVTSYLNEARAAFVLETDQQLSREQTRDLRAAWDEQTKGEKAGGTPILAWGLKANKITQSNADGQLAQLLQMSQQNVALAFRMPLQILGIGGTPYASTELLMQSWIASGLGFALNHIEEAFGLLFRLKGLPSEYLEFDTRALLRSAYRERIEAMARSVISGMHSPDEAREDLDLPKVAGGYGKEPRVQQQVVPLSWAVNHPPALPAPAAAPSPAPPDDDEAAQSAERGFDGYSSGDLLDLAAEIGRVAA